jgi:hypothetical protein
MAADGPTGWVNILADDFTATVSTRALLAQADSHLAQVTEPIMAWTRQHVLVQQHSGLNGAFLRFNVPAFT